MYTLAELHQYTGPDLSYGLEACAVQTTVCSRSSESRGLQMMLLSRVDSFNPRENFTCLYMMQDCSFPELMAYKNAQGPFSLLVSALFIFPLSISYRIHILMVLSATE